MSDEEKIQDGSDVEQDPNLDEEIVLDLEPETETPAPTGEDVEALKAEAADLKAKNRQLYARLKKTEAKEPKLNEPTDDLADIRTTVQKLSLSERKRQYGYETHCSPEEVDAIFAIDPNPTKETLNNPFVKGGLQYLRAKARVASATPSSSGKSPMVNGKTWADLPKEERTQENFAKLMASKRK